MNTGRIYMCEDSLEGILSAVHAAYMSRRSHDSQSVEAGDYAEASLFAETILISTDVSKAMRVADAILHKISGYAWHLVKYAAMSCYTDKANVIYRFLVLGFRIGRTVTDRIADPVVNRIMKLEREVMREKQRFYGFVRFSELNRGILFAKIAPKHRQLPLTAEHFADRYPMENWMIYDERRHEVCVHEAGGGWWIARDVIPDMKEISDLSESQKQFEQWWKTFYETIGIKERENPRCRMQMMPKMYWRNMPEMMGR